ncbi:HNH endonuclease signature motif containing protein [uncultured Corynebacterium sp.]|uniref:HNH endonuclease signature motif containing protein n=1 Tax=uncultured Corynebacterium sp. TaxID=159447 RepID=UPI003457A642
MVTSSWPGCNKPAEESEIHHIHAWKHGGFTNPENLVTPLSAPHRANNDDPTKPSRRGRIDRLGGKTAWSPVWGIVL